MKIVITIMNHKEKDRKAIVNSIKGIVKAFSKQFGFESKIEIRNI